MNRSQHATASGTAGLTIANSRALYATVMGGLVAGTLDIMQAFILWAAVRDATAIQVLQGVAAGLLGRDSFSGGLPAAALGAVLHYFISFCAAGFYYAASRKLPVLVRQPVLCGITYGFLFYLLMTFIVVPLSAAPMSRPPTFTWDGVFAHTILFGLTIALISRHATRRVP
jgi:hypothetical protein